MLQLIHLNLVPPIKIPYSTCEYQCEQESQIYYATEAWRPEVPLPASTHYYPSAYRHNLKTTQHIWLCKQFFKSSINTPSNFSKFTALVSFLNVADPSFTNQSLPRNSQSPTQPDDSLPYSKQQITALYPEPDQSSPSLPTYFLRNPF
jgi:hypothetical protein